MTTSPNNQGTIQTKRRMIANLQAQQMVELPDDLETVNVSNIVRKLTSLGANVSYPSILNLIKGRIQSVKGFQLVEVTPLPASFFKPIEREPRHNIEARTPIAVQRNSSADKILSQMIRGMDMKVLTKHFPAKMSNDDMVKAIQDYANNYGYDVFYSHEEQYVQLILPEGQHSILYID